jgi:cell division control protein 6
MDYVQRVLSLLSASSPPPEHDDFWLPCREAEGRAINTFLRSCLSTKEYNNTSKSSIKSKQNHKRALYIAGKPGTGKTASVNRILSRLMNELKQPGVSSGSSPKYRSCNLVHINAVSLLGNSRTNIFTEISKKLGLDISEKGFDPVKELEASLLPSRKPSRRSKMTVVMIDEIDALLSEQMTGKGSSNSQGRARFQNALYRLFEWPLRKNSKLILIAIANRIDLLSRFLPLLGRNNVEPKIIIFEPYNHVDVKQILQARLNAAAALVDSEEFGGKKRSSSGNTATAAESMFTPVAMERLARTIASNNGDARRALELLRTHIEQKLLQFQQHKRSREQWNQELVSSSSSSSSSNPRKMPKFSHVTATINSTYGSKVIGDIRSLPIECQIILIVFAQHIDTSNKTVSLKLTVGKLHQLYCSQSRKLQHDAVRSISDFVSLVQTLINESVMTTSNSKKKLNEKSILKPRVRLDDVQNALYPIISSKYAKQKDTPTIPQQTFFSRFASAANRGSKGTYYNKGANQVGENGTNSKVAM